MKWQYRIEEDEKRLPLLGEQGWEMVSVHSGKDGNPKFYFKKPIPELKERITEEQRKEIYQQLGLEGHG